jgi:hypothetical protein
MRISSDPQDPGYAQWRAARDRGVFYDVELDGVLLTEDCVSADEARGEAVRLMRDTRGRILLEPAPVCGECGRPLGARGGARVAARETLRGTVKLIERRR